MGSILNSIFSGAFLVPLMVIIVIIAILSIIKIIANNYIKVPPNKVAIFYGRKRKTRDGKTVGFNVVTGGGKLRIPILESVTYIDLNMFPIDLPVKGVPNKDGVLVNVKAVANVKILSDEASLRAACERFLGKPPSEIKEIAFKNLEGHLRGIIGRLTVEEIVSDRTRFNQEVLQEAATDLRKIGLGVDVLTIQEIDDEYGYIKALGQKRTAEVMRDATIGKAEAERDATLRATTAKREAEQKANENMAIISEAEKERQVKQATYQAAIEREKATASQSGPLAAAKAKQEVIEQEVEVERRKTIKEAEVAQAEADRKEKELMATVIKPAEAEKKAAIAKAEGQREATIRTAEAAKQKMELEGQGSATAIRAKGLAEADVIKLKLLAEAEGLLKKAEAYEKLDASGRLLQILEKVREILPEALEKFATVMGETTKPLANVDRISIVDFGSGNGSGANGGAVARFAQVGPAIFTQLCESLKALGFDPSKLEEFLKVNPKGPEPPKPAAK
jgi:flotillin